MCYNKENETKEVIKMKKRITNKDWEYIGTHKGGAKWVHPFCVYTLEEVQKGTIKQEIKIGLLGYLLLFIPVHLFKLVWCLWDGGLKEFEFEGRHLSHHYLYEADVPYCDFYPKAKEILEKA